MSEQAQHLATFSITDQQCLEFADLSGDWNPIHVDRVAARRLQFGQPVVHGLNATMRALDLFLSRFSQRVRLVDIAVTYSKPVTPGQDMETQLIAEDTSNYRIEVLSGGRRTQVIQVTLAERSGGYVAQLAEHVIPRVRPREFPIDQLEGLEGSIHLGWHPALAANMFPGLVRVLPATQIAFLLGLTNIVGMQCPGLNSIFAGFKILFQSAQRWRKASQ